MTFEEKIKMYKNKKAFIKKISKAFEASPGASTVTSIEYEVYSRKVTINNEERDHYVEYVIVNFFGGGKSAKFVSGNSCTANFRALGSMLDGGYYDENHDYETLSDRGFTIVDLDAVESKLDSLLRKPMLHISAVRDCFNHCRTKQDVERVIDMIPSVFGTFEVEYDDEDESVFIITNEYCEAGDIFVTEAEYYFWDK